MKALIWHCCGENQESSIIYVSEDYEKLEQAEKKLKAEMPIPRHRYHKDDGWFDIVNVEVI